MEADEPSASELEDLLKNSYRPPSVGTLCVTYDTMDRKYRMFYNPRFILYGAIKDFIVNSSSYESLEKCYFYMCQFYLAHEAMHVMRGHISPNNHFLKGIDGQTINLWGDAFINMSLVKVLGSNSRFVVKPTYPAVGITSELIFKGNLADDLVGKGAQEVFEKINPIFKQFIGKVANGFTFNYSGNSGEKLPAGKAIVKYTFPTENLCSYFSDVSVDMVRFGNGVGKALLNGSMTLTDYDKARQEANDDIKKNAPKPQNPGGEGPTVDQTFHHKNAQVGDYVKIPGVAGKCGKIVSIDPVTKTAEVVEVKVVSVGQLKASDPSLASVPAEVVAMDRLGSARPRRSSDSGGQMMGFATNYGMNFSQNSSDWPFAISPEKVLVPQDTDTTLGTFPVKNLRVWDFTPPQPQQDGGGGGRHHQDVDDTYNPYKNASSGGNAKRGATDGDIPQDDEHDQDDGGGNDQGGGGNQEDQDGEDGKDGKDNINDKLIGIGDGGSINTDLIEQIMDKLSKGRGIGDKMKEKDESGETVGSGNISIANADEAGKMSQAEIDRMGQEAGKVADAIKDSLRNGRELSDAEKAVLAAADALKYVPKSPRELTWQQKLKKQILDCMNNNPIWSPNTPNRRIGCTMDRGGVTAQLGSEIELPTLEQILLAIDTSSSKGADQFALVINEIFMMMKSMQTMMGYSMPNIEYHVIGWNETIKYKRLTTPSRFKSIIELVASQEGGLTDIYELCLFLAKRGGAYDVIIIFTDGGFNGRCTDDDKIHQECKSIITRFANRIIWVTIPEGNSGTPNREKIATFDKLYYRREIFVPQANGVIKDLTKKN